MFSGWVCLLKDQSHWLYRCCRQVDGIQSMLNPSKSKFLWCSSPRRVPLLDQSAFVLRDCSVDVSSVLRTLVHSSMLQCWWMITSTDSSDRATTSCAGYTPCLHWQRLNSWIHSSFHEWTIVTAFWLAYRSINSTGCSLFLNMAARLIFGYSRYDHIPPLLRDQLYWLRVIQRIDFKLCLMVFKALHGIAPGYISDNCVRVSTNQRRSSLLSVSHNCLVVPPPSKTIKFG